MQYFMSFYLYWKTTELMLYTSSILAKNFLIKESLNAYGSFIAITFIITPSTFTILQVSGYIKPFPSKAYTYCEIHFFGTIIALSLSWGIVRLDFCQPLLFFMIVHKSEIYSFIFCLSPPCSSSANFSNNLSSTFSMVFSGVVGVSET